MHKGSCLCGEITYKITSEPKAITSCHCAMCQKQHGAAFATYGSIPANDLVYLTGENNISTYKSSDTVTRTFCKLCGSNLTWHDTSKYPEWISIAVSTLDTKLSISKVKDIYVETKVSWHAAT